MKKGGLCPALILRNPLLSRLPSEDFSVLSSTYFPEWQAEVDGEKTPLLRANGMFQGLWVAPGAHHVVVHYHSIAFLQGLGLASCGMIGLALWTQST